MKYSSTCWGESSAQILFRDSTACAERKWSARSPERFLRHASPYLVSHDGLLYSREVFEGRQQDMSPLCSADVLNKCTKFFAEGYQDLIFVLNALCAESQRMCIRRVVL